MTESHDILSDFTSQISDAFKEIGQTYISGSFGMVYRCTIGTSEGTVDVAVKVFKIDPGRAVEKHEKAIRRELKVWLRLSKHQTIVPLLGIAHVESPLPALISQWMPSGTLYTYLERGIITASARVKLVMGVADGLKYLHSEGVVHGDLHPANVLIDGSGRPRLTDFGLATVAGDAESQLNTTTAGRNFNPQWRAPEVIGIHSDSEDPVQPNFKSDVYSFGGVMFFIISGVTPWKEKRNPHQIIAELLKRATPARPNNIPDDRWNLIQQCWSWEPMGRPEAREIIERLATKGSTIRTIPPGMADSTTRTIPLKVAARNEHGTTSCSDTTGLPDGHLPRRNKTVVIFGQSGTGKSSLVNLMAGKEVATTSPDVQRCTVQWKDYTIDFGGDSYKIFETFGLEGPRLEIREYFEFAENAYRLIRELDNQGGIDLLLFCIRAGVWSPEIQSNYRLFHEFLCERKVPIVLVITCLEREKRMEDWWARNHITFEKYQIQAAGHACINAENRSTGRHRALYEESRITIRNLVRQFTADGQKQAWIGGDDLFVSLMRKLKELLSVGSHVKRRDIISRLTKRCGISPDVAKQLANMIKQNVG